MNGLKPCPECGGPVEMNKAGVNKKTKKIFYRIHCPACEMTVWGNGFSMESKEEQQERIRQYEEILKGE